MSPMWLQVLACAGCVLIGFGSTIMAKIILLHHEQETGKPLTVDTEGLVLWLVFVLSTIISFCVVDHFVGIEGW